MMKNLRKGWIGLLALAMVALISCNKEDPDPDPEPTVANGYYIVGASTALTEAASDGKMAVAKNEANQTALSSLLEMYVAISASGDGFNIVKVIDGVETVLGPGSDFEAVAEADLDNEEPRDGLWRGSYVESETAFTVPENGLYHVIIDNANELVAIARVKWGLIGAATPGSWSASTQLDEPTFDLNTMEYSKTNVSMTVGEFKYRYSNGWKIYLTDDVRVNTNFGGSVAALDAGGANISNETAGVYTATMTWTLGDDFVATLVKTGDVPLTDYSDYEVGLIGDGVWAEADTAWGWGSTYDKVLPAVDGTNYSWSWDNVEVHNSGSFKIRQGDDWNGLNLGFGNVTMAGTSAGDFSDADGNIKVAADGFFNMVLSVDADGGDFILTVDPVVK